MKPQSPFYSRYFTYIKPVTKIPIVRTYGSTIFTLFVITFFVLYAIKPTVETILVLQKKLEDSNQVLAKVNQKAKDLSTAKQNLDRMDPTIRSKISNSIPDNVTLRTMIQTLEQSAQLHQASISALQIQPLTIDPKQEVKLGTIGSVDFTFNTEGRYEDLVAILQDLKTSARLVSIEGISLSSNSETSGLVMSVSGKAYYIK